MRSPRPRANRVSVTEGASETMRCGEAATSMVRPSSSVMVRVSRARVGFVAHPANKTSARQRMGKSNVLGLLVRAILCGRPAVKTKHFKKPVEALRRLS